MIGISEDEPEDKDKIPEFVKTYGAKFAIGWDEDKSVARHYKPETMPSSFIVDRKGIVRFVHKGYHDGEEVSIEKELKDAPRREVALSRTRTGRRTRGRRSRACRYRRWRG